MNIVQNNEAKGENIVCSPFSLYVLLGSLINAVNGKGREEIVKAISDEKLFGKVTEEVIRMQAALTQKCKYG